MGEVRFYFIRPKHDPEKYVNVEHRSRMELAPFIQWTHAVQEHGQFLFVPTNKPHEYYIVARHSGQLATAAEQGPVRQARLIDDPARVQLQKFRLANMGENSYAVHAQRTGHDRGVWDLSWGSGLDGSSVLLRDWGGGNTQIFYMPESAVIGIADLRTGSGKPFRIPDPPPVEEHVAPDRETPPVLIGEMYIPYFLVREQISPWNDPAYQVSHSPYYLLARQQFWRITHAAVHQTNEGMTCKTKRVVGASREVSKSFEETTKISFSADGTLVIKAVTAVLKFGLEHTLKSTTTETYRDYDETTKEEDYRFRPGRIRHAVWQLIDQYQLRRGDGSEVSKWEDKPSPYFHSDTYPRNAVMAANDTEAPVPRPATTL